jgi:hypothetical protein
VHEKFHPHQNNCFDLWAMNYPPIFHLDATGLTVKSERKYFGINLRTDTRNLFENHYKAKSMHACYCGHRIMMIEDLTGRLLPKEPIQLYMARINFHLIHGCEISPDSEDMHLKQLCKVQLLGIHQSNTQSLHRSLIALPFTETGLMPI